MRSRLDEQLALLNRELIEMGALCEEVIAKDDVVDEDFRKVKATLIDWIAQRPDDGEYALDLLMIAKYFERIGDHATNIAGWVVFAVTGAHEGEEN